MINFSLPNISDIENLSSQKDTRKVKSYLTQLTEQLRYMLNNIDTDNLSEDLRKQYEKNIGVAEAFAKLNYFVVGASEHQDELINGIVDAEQDLKKQYEILADAFAKEAIDVRTEYKADIQSSKESLTSTLEANYTLLTKTESLEQDFKSAFEQTARNIMAIFTEEYALDSDDPLKDFSKQFSTYIRFDSEGIEIGKTDNIIIAKLTNNELAFGQKSGEKFLKVAYISNKKLYITEAQVLNQLTIGNEANGYLCDIKISSEYGLVISMREA